MSARVPLTGADRIHVARQLAIHESVARDLRDLLANGAPTPGELEAMGAPLLDAWATATRPAACLVGVVSGHPTLDGPVVRTSDVVVVVRAARAARTKSRWYRLGTALGDETGELH